MQFPIILIVVTAQIGVNTNTSITLILMSIGFYHNSIDQNRRMTNHSRDAKNQDLRRRNSKFENRTQCLNSFKVMQQSFFSQCKNDQVTFIFGFLGSCRISLEPVFMEGSVPPAAYNVVKDEEYCGEIRIGLTFTPEVILCIGPLFPLLF